jgi:hypothetical protein
VKRILWGPIGIIFLLGVVLSCVAELIQTGLTLLSVSGVLQHFGIALIISAVVGICLEITAFKDFLEQRIIGILFGDDFTKLVSDNNLVDMNIKAMNALGNKRITNTDYNYQDFVRAIGRELLDTIAKIYRKGYREVIKLRVLDIDEIKELNVDPSIIRTDVDIVRIESNVEFSFVVPNKDGEHSFPIKSSYKCYAPSELLDKFEFEILANGAIIVHVEGRPSGNTYVTRDGESQSLEWDKGSLFLTRDGEKLSLTRETESLSFDYYRDLMSYEKFSNDINEYTEVTYEPKIEYKRVSYQYDPRSLNSYLDILTNQVEVTFSSREEVMPKAEFFGLSVNTTKGTDNLASISNPDWGLPEDGYFISWQQKKTKPVS